MKNIEIGKIVELRDGKRNGDSDIDCYSNSESEIDSYIPRVTVQARPTATVMAVATVRSLLLQLCRFGNM